MKAKCDFPHIPHRNSNILSNPKSNVEFTTSTP